MSALLIILISISLIALIGLNIIGYGDYMFLLYADLILGILNRYNQNISNTIRNYRSKSHKGK